MLLTSIKPFPTIDRFFMSKPDDWIPLMTASAVVETLKRSFRPIQPLSGLPACFGGANLIRAPKLKEKKTLMRFRRFLLGIDSTFVLRLKRQSRSPSLSLRIMGFWH